VHTIRNDAWRNVKCRLLQEFVVGGWRRSDAEGCALSSPLVGCYARSLW
jgi:hypothetical protein